MPKNVVQHLLGICLAAPLVPPPSLTVVVLMAVIVETVYVGEQVGHV